MYQKKKKKKEEKVFKRNLLLSIVQWKQTRTVVGSTWKGIGKTGAKKWVDDERKEQQTRRTEKDCFLLFILKKATSSERGTLRPSPPRCVPLHTTAFLLPSLDVLSSFRILIPSLLSEYSSKAFKVPLYLAS